MKNFNTSIEQFDESYIKNSHLQTNINNKIIERFALQICKNFYEGKYGSGPLKIVDLACGHGEPTYKLLLNLVNLSVPVAKIIGYDISESLIKKANDMYATNPLLSFELCNLENLNSKQDYDQKIS